MAWLGSWKYRRKLSISNTNIDAVLSNFPILVQISASSGTGSTDLTDIFDELTAGANRKKIAITISDGTTQCYVEIERWNDANEKAVLWVKVPSVASGVVTELYIYYDSAQSDNTTYVGDTTDAAAQSVWDSNFKLVMHMAQDPNGDSANAIKDSTNNANHGTPAGAMTSADLVDGKVGKAIDFDGGDDNIEIGHDPALVFGAPDDVYTLECVFKTSVLNNALVVKSRADTSSSMPWLLTVDDGYLKFNRWNQPNAQNDLVLDDTKNVTDNTYHYGAFVNVSDNDHRLFVDEIKTKSDTTTWTYNNANTDYIRIGRYQNATYSNTYLTGIGEEVRISNTARSSAWLKATYYSNWDDLASYGIAVEYSLEVILPSPFSATASLQSNIQIELVPGILLAESSISVDEIFWGNFVECPSPFGATSTLQAKTSLEVAINPFIVQTNLQGNIQLELVAPSFTAQSELSIGEIFRGYLVDLSEPFSANASLQANTQIEIITASLIATSALLSNIGIEVSAGALNVTGAILGTPVYPIILTGAKRIYLFTLTGIADGIEDIIIPIRSFQNRIKSGDPTYLSVVIPGTEYASAINARLNGDLIIRMGYQNEDEILLTEIVSKVLFENIIIYEGPTNKSITLDGHRTETWTPKAVSLENASYRNLTKGKLRYRCKPDLYLRPGDTANINDDSFTVESITYSVSSRLETYEITE